MTDTMQFQNSPLFPSNNLRETVLATFAVPSLKSGCDEDTKMHFARVDMTAILEDTSS